MTDTQKVKLSHPRRDCQARQTVSTSITLAHPTWFCVMLYLETASQWAPTASPNPEFLFQPQLPKISTSLYLLKYQHQILGWLDVDEVHSVYSHCKYVICVCLVHISAIKKQENTPNWAVYRLSSYLLVFLNLLAAFSTGMNSPSDLNDISLDLMTFTEHICILLAEISQFPCQIHVAARTREWSWCREQNQKLSLEEI